MDVTPPGAAGTASRPSRNTPSGIPLVLHRLAIGLAGAALAVLAGVACALSFDDLRALAVTGQAEPQLAYLYPTAFDVLLIVALVSVPLLRGARFLVRLQAGFVLIVLLASAAAANAATAVGVSFDSEVTTLVVALLPWVMLAIGLWLLLLLLKHVRTNRADLDDDDSDDDLVPFDGERGRRAAVTDAYPAPVREPARVTQERGAPPLQPVPEAVAPRSYVPPAPVGPVSETVAPPEHAPPSPAAPSRAEDEPTATRPVAADSDEDGVRLSPGARAEAAAEAGSETTPHQAADQAPSPEQGEPETPPTVPPTAAHRTPSVTPPAESAPPAPVTETATDPAAETATEAVTETAVQTVTDEYAREAEPVAAETPAQPAPTAPSPAETDDHPAQPRRNRPVRWGDLVRPRTGDVLVHPRPKPEKPSGIEPARPEDEAGVDTQPLRQIKDVPDPAHAPDSADPAEQGGGRGPSAVESGDQGAPQAGEAREEGPEEGTVPIAPPSGRMRSTPRPPA
ncbi:hypothetical protein GCM10010116_11430 [Microbispora rosea subsp. aerata]|nr:DUF2637 domain-containing protein [Microbispora rosea]GGO05830.1 hypothetical protein GCM10010116_11430 [Microbispora rosea subsp. aerata]GIH55248.1 hypothetical protein Mro02_21620 [Microbispora rosea subsp. aerata]GLJ82698.1 hypothetical protein GCM10017588_14230 [Microbispora rosea subsp. aerata]